MDRYGIEFQIPGRVSDLRPSWKGNMGTTEREAEELPEVGGLMVPPRIVVRWDNGNVEAVATDFLKVEE